MYDIHTTQEGDTLLICCMGNEHLLNTIRSFTSRIQAAVQMLTSQTLDDPLIAVFQPGYSKAAMQEKAKETVEFLHERLQPYVVEAALRGLDVTELLQKAYGRTAAVPMQSARLLETGNDVEVNTVFPL